MVKSCVRGYAELENLRDITLEGAEASGQEVAAEYARQRRAIRLIAV